ncbi:MAG: ABC transporter substrate-binding protein [Candidatus Roizmanbacteria bacterium]|nr:MAG: ABC transporter substrate-binding protein [Candidatus Roizmanbacteria bacterium]
MIVKQKTLRYYYWVAVEFAKKHLKLIVVSFFLSIVAIVSFISFSPYIINFATAKNEIIGVVGTGQINNLPDFILSKISNGLIFINEKGQIISVLVEKWDQSKDGKTYHFYLKKNIYWNDGSLFTAKGINYDFKDVEMKIINDYEIEFQLKKPLPIFPTYLTKPLIKYPFVGVAGLYKVDSFKSQYGNLKEIYLSPNKSNFPYLVYKFYENETKTINAYKLGEVTQIEVTRQSVLDYFASWKNTVIDKNVDYTRLMTLFFNMNSDYLKQKDIRKAIISAISKKQFKDEGVESIGPIPPISWAYNLNLKKTGFDPEMSDKILNKSMESSKSATLQIATYYDYLYIAEAIKSDLEKVGLNIKINTLSYNQPSSFDMLLAYWKVPLDPDQYYFWHSTQKQGNIANYNNIKIDKLLEDGRSVTSVEERKKIYFDFQRTILDDAPAYFIFYPYIYTIRRK